MPVIYLLDPPDWVRAGESIDILEPEDGIWYHATVKCSGTLDDNDRALRLTYSRFTDTMHKFSEIKENIRPHEEERMTKPRINAKLLTQLKKLKKHDSVMVHDSVTALITTNDPMRCEIVFEQYGIKKYEEITLVSNKESEVVQKKKTKNASKATKSSKGTTSKAATATKRKTTDNSNKFQKKRATVIMEVNEEPNPPALILSSSQHTGIETAPSDFNVDPPDSPMPSIGSHKSIHSMLQELNEKLTRVEQQNVSLKDTLQNVQAELVSLKTAITQHITDQPSTLPDLRLLGDESFTQLLNTSNPIPTPEPVPAGEILEAASAAAGIIQTVLPRSNSSITATPIALAVSKNTHGRTFSTINATDLNVSGSISQQAQSSSNQSGNVNVTQLSAGSNVTQSSVGNVSDLSLHNPKWKQYQLKAREKRDYFSWLLVNEIFSEAELKGRNCSGICADAKKKGKTKGALDPTKLTFVYDLCFHFFPLKGHESLSVSWTKCQDNINSRLRGRFGKENYLEPGTN